MKLSSISPKWWKQRIPEDVRNSAEIRKEKNEKQWPWYENIDESLMAYVDFTDYQKIITRADNWKEIFKDVFHEQELISAKFKELYPIRNKFAHSRDPTEQDSKRLKLHAEDILLLIGRAQHTSVGTTSHK